MASGDSPEIGMSTNEAVRQIYDRLWAETIERFAAGEVHLDRYLSRQDPDHRTGITLIAGPIPIRSRDFLAW